MKPNILERALTGHKTNKYYIYYSTLTRSWRIIHKGRFIHEPGDPTHIHARRRAHYHWKGFIR